MYYYALTIKRTREPNLLSDYQTPLETLKAFVTSKNEQYYEQHFEKTKGLHVHVYFSTKRKCTPSILYKMLKMGYGWRFECEDCREKKAWLQYIRKDHKGEEQLLNDEKMKECYNDLELPYSYEEPIDEEEGETAASPPRGLPSESQRDSASDEQSFIMPKKRLF